MKKKHNVYLAAIAVLTSASVMAQEKPAARAKPAQAGEQSEQVNTVLVTGTSTARAGINTPLSTIALNSKDLARATGNSQADILATLPGIKAEGGGGEIAANIQVRGLPSSGQYQFTPLEYDGMPALSTFGLNSSAYDIFYRNDLGVQRLEFVTGGVSNLFGPGSVAGIFNFISKTGGDSARGIFQVEAADKGRLRTDMFLSGPISNRTYYALSGFYRYDEGPLKSGFPTKGGQLRGNIKHEFEDGGSVTFYLQLIDDIAQFYAPIPLDGKSYERVNGTDGRLVNTTNTRHVRGLTSILPGGQRLVSRIDEGASVRGASFGMAFDRELGNGFGLNGKVKYASYKHQFNFFVDGDGGASVPETQAQYMSNRAITGPAAYTYVDSGQALAANTLLFANRIINRDRPTEDFSTELNLTKKFTTGTAKHNVTLGSWAARVEADDNTLTQIYLAEFADQPRLVNLTANGVNYTRNGLVDPSVGYTQNTHIARRAAAYLADQIEMDRWAFDAGVRVENMKADLSREVAATFNGISQGGTNESAALTSAVYGTGRYLTGTVKTTEWAGSLGALYKLDKNLNLYGNFSHGYFFPEIRSVQFNSLGQPSSYEGEIINQTELGAKYTNGPLVGTVALFHSTLKNRRNVSFQNIGGGAVGEVVTLISTEAKGIEVTGAYKFSRALSLSGNATFTDHEYTQGFAGKELERKPKTFANASLNYDDNRFDGSISWNYQSRAFTSTANNIVLPGYDLWRLTAGYKMSLSNGQSVRFGASVFNLFDEQGLAEGSPRQGPNQTAGGVYFVGRPILPRRFTVTATYSF